jgi:hypothetical protein
MSTLVPPVTLADLGEPWIGDIPWLDRPNWDSHDAHCIQWQREGFLILHEFIPDDLIANYGRAWITDNAMNADRPMGWPYDVPYMHVPEVRELCCWQPLGDILHKLLGEEMGVHLNLSGWRSTQRSWHQDGYLNPDTTRDYYAAVWIALDDIHPDSGPFEYIPGSHRLIDPIREQSMRAALTPEEAASSNWPRYSERILDPLFEQLIVEQDLPVRQFIAQRGDVLIWHSRLLHRGSTPKDPTRERRSLISHYSGLNHRPDMPQAQRRDGESWFYPISQLPL